MQDGRQLVAGEPPGAPVAQLLDGQRRGRVQRGDRDRGLAPAFVRDADHGQLGHGRVHGERVLDLGAVDVLAAGDDHVLLAVDDVKEAF